MKILVFIVIFSYVALEKVSGRKCYNCVSNDSFENCDDNRKEIDCPSPSPQVSDFSCFKLSYKRNGTTIYGKGCNPTRECKIPASSEPLCVDKTIEDCQRFCCDSDLCNKGAGVQLISEILLLTSVILGLFSI